VGVYERNTGVVEQLLADCGEKAHAIEDGKGV
jgi:hypothetical protein